MELSSSARELLGFNVRKYRLAAGLSQDGLGQLAHKSRQWVSKVEHGNLAPNVSYLDTFVEIFGVEHRELLSPYGEEDFLRLYAYRSSDVPQATLQVAMRSLDK